MEKDGALSQADFVLDTFFPKWEHFACIGAIPTPTGMQRRFDENKTD
jgi:hypothetical protein